MTITNSQLLQQIEQYESLQAEKEDIASQQKDIMAEIKASGHEPRVVKRIIRTRKRGEDEVAQEDAEYELYKTSLGMK